MKNYINCPMCKSMSVQIIIRGLFDRKVILKPCIYCGYEIYVSHLLPHKYHGYLVNESILTNASASPSPEDEDD